MLVNCENTAVINPGPENVPPEKGYVQLDSGHRMLIADDAGLPAEEQERMEQVAEKLAVAHVHEHNPEKVNIPEKMIDYFYNGLVHLHHSDLPEAVEITDHPLVVHSPPSAREVVLWIKEQKPWVEKLRETKSSTGIPEIDEVIRKFEMSLTVFREYSSGDMAATAKMRSDQPVNVYAAGELFSALPQIEEAGADPFTSGGRDITAAVNDGYLVLDITVGWGDCMAGCISKLNRVFRISADGIVELHE